MKNCKTIKDDNLKSGYKGDRGSLSILLQKVGLSQDDADDFIYTLIEIIRDEAVDVANNTIDNYNRYYN